MESIVRNVKDIEAGERQVYEQVLGKQLQDNQQVIIRVIDLERQPEQQAKEAALADLRKLSEKGSRHRQAQGVSEEEIGEAIDEAISETRRQKRQQAG